MKVTTMDMGKTCGRDRYRKEVYRPQDNEEGVKVDDCEWTVNDILSGYVNGRKMGVLDVTDRMRVDEVGFQEGVIQRNVGVIMETVVGAFDFSRERVAVGVSHSRVAFLSIVCVLRFALPFQVFVVFFTVFITFLCLCCLFVVFLFLFSISFFSFLL